MRCRLTAIFLHDADAYDGASGIWGWMRRTVVGSVVRRAVATAVAKEAAEDLPWDAAELSALAELGLPTGFGSIPSTVAAPHSASPPRRQRRRKKKKKHQQQQQQQQQRAARLRLRVGDRCEAYYAGDGLYYPVDVVTIDDPRGGEAKKGSALQHSTEVFTVRFVGYGDVQQLPADWLRSSAAAVAVAIDAVVTADAAVDPCAESKSVRDAEEALYFEWLCDCGAADVPTLPPPHHHRARPKSSRRAKARGGSSSMGKYYAQRYRLFSRFDEGIKLDEEGWYSVTPEVLAAHTATRIGRMECEPTTATTATTTVKMAAASKHAASASASATASLLIVDGFAGVGGNAIQFALAGHRVVAVEIDAARLALAQHNAEVYGVSEAIEWVHGDFLALSATLRGDAVFVAPPWGGPAYLTAKGLGAGGASFDLDRGIPLVGGAHGVMRAALRVSPNVAFVLPRSAGPSTVDALASAHCAPSVARELERDFINGKLKMTTAFFGALAALEDEAEDAVAPLKT